MAQSLCIGFLITESAELPAWEFEILQQILNSDFATVPVFILSPKRIISSGSFLFRLFRRFENVWFRHSPDAFKLITITELLKNSSVFHSWDINSLKQFDLDIIYSSCLVSYEDGIISAARSGIWSINFGDGKYKEGNPPAFWEVMNNEAVTGSSLEVQLPKTEKKVTVYAGRTSSVPYSVKNNLNSIAWKSSSFFPCRIKEYFLLGPEIFFRKYRIDSIQNHQMLRQGKFTYPGNITMFWLFFKNIFLYIRYKFRIIFTRKRFTILFSNEQFNGKSIELSKFKALPLPGKTFWGDPFIMKSEHRQFVFFEEYVYKTGKGHISVVEMNIDNTCSDPVTLLERQYHLSYPFVFEWEESFYMIPETSSNKTVELYKSKDFPFEWEFVMNLMENIILIDATLVYSDGKWWMFGNTNFHPFTSLNDQLVLFYSDSLISNKWQAHPQNPVVTDISNCRPAGKIFRIYNDLYRPAQNNASQQYGYALKLNKIITLTAIEYKEEEVFEIKPDKKNYLSAVHTINFTEDLIVIDGILRK